MAVLFVCKVVDAISALCYNDDMEKSDNPVTYSMTELTEMSSGKITRKLLGFPFIIVTYQGDAQMGYEVHPPGTGERLEKLEAKKSDE